MLDADRCDEWAFGCWVNPFFPPGRGILLDFAVRWCDHLADGLGAQPLVASIREDAQASVSAE
ncbi:hypothetical protein ACIA6T_35010 [Streptomyces sp. NPDC051740]|uniref:hypothetical protein n=1 Tax=Streptomyces sp. NPDC051740 TaxID=3365673 RepID=UPI0037B4E2A4